MTAIAIDVGARYARIAQVTADGIPSLVELPGTVAGEGLPVPGGADPDRTDALRAAYAAYQAHRGTPDRVVLVVPQQEPARYAQRAAEALGSGDAPRPRTLGTAHAVLALLRHAGQAAAGRYAVCDLGATRAEVSVCLLAPGSVAVTAGSRHRPAAGFGAGFDAALLAAAGMPDGAGAHALLAAARGEDGAAERLDVALSGAERHPDRYGGTAVHHLAGREITAGAVLRAVRDLTAGLDLALDEALRGAPADAPRPVAVGGAARLGPLLRHLDARLGPSVPLPGRADPALAAAYGAALVAAGLVDPADRYPHAVCVGTHRIVTGEPRSAELVVSPAGSLEPGGATVFAQAGGERVRVRTGGPERAVRVRVRDAGGSRSAPVATLALPESAAGDRYHVGVRIAADGTARLVLHPLGPGRPGEFPLGALPTQLTNDPEGVRS